ncbi:MAG: TerB family tellurite resistance protein [Gemmatimonadaceae bacterium]|nr:TerB family tellurite resistance protein [Gemmatimonadaceae bacterium]
MTPQDAETIVAIAALAAQADGQQDDAERTRIREMAAGLSLADSSVVQASTMAASVGDHAALARLTESLSDAQARQTAYDTAVSVCYADGWINPSEAAFLRTLAAALDVDPTKTDRAAVAAQEPLVAAPNAPAAGAAASGDLPAHILDQAILSAALELLPDRLANLGILPLQLRLVHQIGARHGQQMNASQVKDLAAVFGIGAAAQIMEKVVRNALGGFAGLLGRGALGGLLGGIAGNAAGVAAGASVTFATTYALGHAAEQYYAQGRSLSTADMKALFARLQSDATSLFPTVEARVRDLARNGNVGSLLRGSPR